MLKNMSAVKQKYARSSISKSQIKLLELVYKYRFVSRLLVADSLGIKPENGLFRRLEVLVKYEYLGKRFDKRLKLAGVPAAYYLTPKGLRALQAVPGHEYITEAVLKGSYRDKSVGQDFITHMLGVYEYTNTLKRQYPGLRVFTRREIGQYEYFPSQIPDAVLSIPTDNPKQPKRFFFDLVSDTMPRSALDRRIANYCEFFDEGGWDVTGSPLPIILLLCEWSTAEKRISRNVWAQLSRSDMEELPVYTSTTSALDNPAGELIVWTSVEDTDELTDLSSIS